MVKVYVADIKPLFQESCFCARIEQMDKERRIKIDNCIQQADKIRSLAAGVLLQAAWEEFNRQKYGADSTADKFVVRYGKGGKPYCENRPEFYFNLSHSGNYAVCAVSKGKVGIDIQKEKTADLKVAERFFSIDESNKIKNVPEADKNRIFYKIWTFKESYIKYTGRGMSQGLGTFSLDDKIGIVIDGTSEETVFVHQFDDIEGYRIAVCSQEEKCLEKLLMIAL